MESQLSKILFERRLPKEARREEDDWGGLSEAKVRRRIQNRLHQRSYRTLSSARGFVASIDDLFGSQAVNKRQNERLGRHQLAADHGSLFRWRLANPYLQQTNKP